jgi:hypothetical protein
MVVCIDFDGTCVTHEFPRIGKDIGAVPVLKKLIEAGHKLILFTMRSDDKVVAAPDASIFGIPGQYLTEAVEWFKENEIPLFGINTNPTQKSWTSSPKAFAQMYIDDASLGCPLNFNLELSNKPFVDWVKVEELLKLNKII